MAPRGLFAVSAKGQGRAPLDALAARWRRRRFASACGLLVAGSLPLEVLLVTWTDAPAWWLPAAAAASLAIVWLGLRGQPGSADLLRHLDRAAPSLEESAELLGSDGARLEPLQRLQRQRVAAALNRLEPAEIPLAEVPTGAPARLAVLALAASLAIWIASPRSIVEATPVAGPERPPTKVEEDLTLSVEVEPPAYTGLEAWSADVSLDGQDVAVVEGSRLRWSLSGLPADAGAALVFDDDELPLVFGPESTDRHGARTFTASRLYYLRVDREGVSERRTPYARVQVAPDKAPAIEIQQPPPFLLIPESGSDRLVIRAEVLDDYSVAGTSLVATVASGTGELVEFRERRFSFPRQDGNARGGSHARVFDLAELGVVPGAELYFYVEAIDNRRPRPGRSRSATHIVRRSGGTGASIGLGDGIPVFAVPDLFRSQRQIILDTEKLLREMPQISDAELARRSQQIGFDQRSLRLRYGVLLGQEVVDGQQLSAEEEALEFEDDEELGELVGELPEGLVHEHDPQDLNTFFDSEVRERMKEALREMWGAEGELRSIAPRRALPFEYRALVLLKQAQERSRIYVQKVGFEAPPLYPAEKRLTGDLSDLRDRTARRSRPDPTTSVAESILEALSRAAEGGLAGDEGLSALSAARQELARAALEGSSADLEALEAAATLEAAAAEGAGLDPRLVARVRGALWKQLPDPERMPGRGEPRGSSAFERYLDALEGAGEGPAG